ncbi:MAG TPA: parvulin peptidyl-prolyl isomerase, partial [Candidatus Marinimicrobia bacterium]|nr:parvulin peptidyl-prolyl isomerase [Candidatus Neomarinimicrobiota bacterium]
MFKYLSHNFKFLFLILFFSQILFPQQLIDGIAAVVGEEIILYSDVQQLALEISRQEQIDLRHNQAAFMQLQQKALRELINSKVLILQAEIDSVEVRDRDIEQALNEQIKQYLSYFNGSEKELEAAMGLPMRVIKEKLYERIKAMLIQQQIQSEKFLKLKITRPEVIAFYNEKKDSIPPLPEKVDISHILLLPKPSDAKSDSVKNFLKNLKENIVSGKIDFADAARQFSQDPGSASAGGDLGFVSKGTFVREYEQQAFHLNPGEISEPIQTQFGLHLIQLLEIRGESIHTRHILIPVEADENDEKVLVHKLSTLAKSIKTKDEFDSLAYLYSEDPEAKNNRGNLGEFALETLQIPEFQQVIKQLNPGEISKPFRSDFGFHIIRLNKRISSDIISLDNSYALLET